MEFGVLWALGHLNIRRYEADPSTQTTWWQQAQKKGPGPRQGLEDLPQQQGRDGFSSAWDGADSTAAGACHWS